MVDTTAAASTLPAAEEAAAFTPTAADYIVLKDLRWQGVIKRRGERFNTAEQKAGFRRTKQMVDARQIEPWTKAAVERLRHTMAPVPGTAEAAAAENRSRARREGRRQKGSRSVEAEIQANADAARAANAPPPAPAPAAPANVTDGVPQALDAPTAAAPLVPPVEHAGVGAAKTNPRSERAAVEEVRGPVTAPPPGFAASATVDFAGGGAYDVRVTGAPDVRIKGQQAVRNYLTEHKLFAPGWNEPVAEPAPAAAKAKPAKKRG